MPLYISDQCTDQSQLCRLYCQGFTKLHSGLDPNELQLKGLTEYLGSYPISDYLGPILGSKWLVMQTIGYHLRLSQTQTFRGNLGKDVSGCT
jgi:hypothetical protein